MARRRRSLGFNNKDLLGYLHREHRSKGGRTKAPRKFASLLLYKNKLRELCDKEDNEEIRNYEIF